MNLRDILSSRTNLDNKEIELSVMLAERYSFEPTLDSFAGKSFRVFDRQGRSVSVQLAELRDSVLHSQKSPTTDVVVFAAGDPPIMIGWVLGKDCRDADDRCLVNVKSLYPMPQQFDFAVPCPHLDDFGGYYNDKDQAWVCFGCGTQIIAGPSRPKIRH